MIIKSKKTRAGDLVVAALCVLLIIICIFPVLNVLSRSLSDTRSLVRHEVMLFPKGLNIDAYEWVLKDPKYPRSLLWTAELTVICSVVSMVMTTLCAYPLTYVHLKGRRVLNTVILLTMYFSAGMIPNYLLMLNLGLLENPLVLIFPNCLSVFNMIIMRSFFYGIPDSLRESAEIDGANPLQVLIRVYIPLSTSVLATLTLFYAVGRWNGFSDALMYIKREKNYYPIQLLLYNTLQNASSVEIATQEGFANPGLSEGLQCAAVMFATVPILLVYPWLQKYFITGATIGAIKE